ncbi:APC family permease [Prochlorococcus marinus]|uniref:Amino acid permease n=1 Tax=Prochlorococcus marinus (strain MIT 9303) TaxID=59922 RepID=A2C8M2_PROM3|nr:APC family permease [Prochlorococcus marinus]ABM77832.1 Hypothetical protein P9303_10831 [Prochlorococcus marinus str. MIT 9303]
MGLRKELNLTSLTMAVVTGTIGSGWLFAPYFAAQLAGAGSLLAWLLGGFLALLLALVFAELGSLVPNSGALAQIPLLTHGRLSGFIGGWSVWLSYVTIPTIELLALLQYLSSSLPWLTHVQGNRQLLSPAGQIVAVILLVLLCWINLLGVQTLSRWINLLTAWKLIVPVLVSIVLMVISSHWSNLAVPVGGDGADVVRAVGSGGILFSLLGFRTAMDLAGEARKPARDVPLAMATGLGICLLLYITLQLSFLISVPPTELGNGWHGLMLSAHGGPVVALAMGFGLGWMVIILLVDALVSPGATALNYMGVSARIIWMMGKCGLLPKALGRLNHQDVPHVAITLSMVVSALMLAIGPGWQTVVNFLTTTLIIALATGPVSLLALRRQMPDAHRGYRLPMADWICRLAFVTATWSISWCGRTALEGSVVCIAIPTLIFAAGRCWQENGMEVRPALWWALYLGLLVGDLQLFSEGQPLALPTPANMAVLAVMALIVLPIAVGSALPEKSPHALLGTE